MKNNLLPRLDERPDLRELLLPHCRLGRGEIWTDPVSGHKIGCLDAAISQDVSKLMDGARAKTATLLGEIRIEVKASRAVDSDNSGPL